MTQRTARKQHQCVLCLEPILPGCVYSDISMGPWDGINDSPYQWRTHLPCAEMCRRWWIDVDEFIDVGSYYEVVGSLCALGAMLPSGWKERY